MENPFDAGYFTTPELREMGFKSIGKNVQIAKTCNIPRLDNIEIGSNVRIDGFTSIISVSGGPVRIGSYIHICISCMIGARGAFEMEDFAGLSHGSIVLTASDDFSGRFLTNSLVPEASTNVRAAPVRLGRHAAIGVGAVILPGVTIGEGAGVGSASLVTKSVPEWEIHAGVPAKCRGERDKGLLVHEAALRHSNNDGGTVAILPIDRNAGRSRRRVVGSVG